MSNLRLKEQDSLIDLIRLEQISRGTAGAFDFVSGLIARHVSSGGGADSDGGADTELRRRCAGVGRIFHPLDLPAALSEFDERSPVIARTLVPPSFAECRKILNLATVKALAKGGLQLLSFDADETLYSDGGVLTFDSPIIPHLIRLLKRGVGVCVVTAAAYPGEPHRYEGRFAGLLAAMAFAIEAGAPKEPLLARFLIMGGQCNYLLRAACSQEGHCARVFLEQVEDEAWKAFRGVRWEHAAVGAMLDVAEATLRRTLGTLRLHASSLLIRKERAVGVVARPGAPPLNYEVLEECVRPHGSGCWRAHKSLSPAHPPPPHTHTLPSRLALATQAALQAHGGSVPFCAFNGGHDVFVDVGTKALGIRALQGLLGARPECSLHVGDRFTLTGNDVSARDVASTLWVASPRETVALMEQLVPLLDAAAGAPSLTAGAGASAGEAAGGGGGALPQLRPSPTPGALAPLKVQAPPSPSHSGLSVSSAHGGSTASLPRSPRAERGPGVGSEASFHLRGELESAAAEAQVAQLRLAGGVVLPS